MTIKIINGKHIQNYSIDDLIKFTINNNTYEFIIKDITNRGELILQPSITRDAMNLSESQIEDDFKSLQDWTYDKKLGINNIYIQPPGNINQFGNVDFSKFNPF